MESDPRSPHPTSELDIDGDDRSSSAELVAADPGAAVRSVTEQGPLSFEAGAGEYFGVCFLNLLLFFVPVFGWAAQWLIMNRFIIEHLRVEGRPMKYTMTYGYALKTIAGNLLMIVLTLGIGLFWLHIKQIKAIFAHAQYADEVAP